MANDKLSRPNLHLQHLPFINLHWSNLAEGIGAEAAPIPLLGFLDRSSGDGSAVHVAQLFDALVVASIPSASLGISAAGSDAR